MRLAVVNSHPIQYFAPLYRELARSGKLEIIVLYCSRQGLSAEMIDPGFGHSVVWDTPLLGGYRHEFMPNVGGDRGVHGFFSLVNPSVISLILRGRFDAIIVHGHNFCTTLMAIAAAKMSGTAVLMRAETHLGLPGNRWKKRLRKPVLMAFYRFIDGFLYIGSRNKAFYEQLHVAPDRLFFTPYTVDNERFADEAKRAEAGAIELKKQLGIAGVTPVVLYASKLISRKRPLDLLLAFTRLRTEGVDAALVFVGDGPLREELQQIALALKISGVHFVGFKNQSELSTYFALASVFVLPSTGEPWGLVVNEALVAGVPVVLTDEIGAASDLVVDGVTGFQYPAGDIAALTDRIKRVIGDTTLRLRMTRAARELMSHWSYRECIDGIVSAVVATTKRRSSGPVRVTSG